MSGKGISAEELQCMINAGGSPKVMQQLQAALDELNERLPARKQSFKSTTPRKFEAVSKNKTTWFSRQKNIGMVVIGVLVAIFLIKGIVNTTCTSYMPPATSIHAQTIR